nr:hypothetical transcript [Hymenolepis microstoma]
MYIDKDLDVTLPTVFSSMRTLTPRPLTVCSTCPPPLLYKIMTSALTCSTTITSEPTVTTTTPTTTSESATVKATKLIWLVSPLYVLPFMNSPFQRSPTVSSIKHVRPVIRITRSLISSAGMKPHIVFTRVSTPIWNLRRTTTVLTDEINTKMTPVDLSHAAFRFLRSSSHTFKEGVWS